MRSIGKFFKMIYDTTQKGFYFLCLIFSRGFYFYFYLMTCGLKKIFRKSKKINNLVVHYRKRQECPEYFFVLLFTCVLLITIYYVTFYDSNEIVRLDEMLEEQEIIEHDQTIVENNNNDEHDEKKPVIPIETNLYKVYGNKSINDINFNELRLVNNDVVAWVIVDGTNINYPIVQTINNDYYLNHGINKKKTSNGWTFLDYRNRPNMSDDNTIFYGHNLLNKTAFGSISNLFTEQWFNSSNQNIWVLTETKIYIYEIFSVYYSDPTSYYLQTHFSLAASRLKFYNTLKEKSVVEFPAIVGENDKIITLSTCTDDNKGRKVVHAKLLSEGFR